MSDEAWMELRRDCERAVFASRGSEATTLRRIYEEVGRRLGWAPEVLDEAIQTELQVELRSLHAVPRTLALWQELSRHGVARRFLSDMYLPETFVASILSRSGYAVAADEVWVSSTRGASKVRGTAFKKIVRSLGIDSPARVLHLGDNRRDDVEQARRAGLDALHLRDASLPAVSLRILAAAPGALRVASLVAGAIRLASRRGPQAAGSGGAPSAATLGHLGAWNIGSLCGPRRPLSHAAAMWRLGTWYAGPLLTLYVWWILLTAEAKGLSRLYFLARDGQILMEIARVLQSTGIASGIDCRYLYASRQALFAPSITQWDEASLARILDEPVPLSTPRKLARRLGFADERQMEAAWPKLTGALASVSSTSELVRLLVSSVPEDAALTHIRGLREVAMRYYREQGLLDGSRWAIVDLGWRGRMQECLTRMLRAEDAAEGVERTRGFYMALLEKPEHFARTMEMMTFGPGEEGSTPLGPAHLLELLCEADHGSTAGFSSWSAAVVKPVFDPAPNRELVGWGLSQYRTAVLEYARSLASSLPLAGRQAPSQETLHAMARAVSQELFVFADFESARAFGSMPCSFSTEHDAHVELSPRLTLIDAWCRALTLGRWRVTKTSTPWLPGSLANRTGRRAFACYSILMRVARKARSALVGMRARSRSWFDGRVLQLPRWVGQTFL